MSQQTDTLDVHEAALGNADAHANGLFARRHHWRMFAGVAAVSISLAWLSLPGQPSQHEINVRLATFAFRV